MLQEEGVLDLHVQIADTITKLLVCVPESTARRILLSRVLITLAHNCSQLYKLEKNRRILCSYQRIQI